MMRVGIITIQSSVNIGNRLQNYALQETIKKLGVECETIRREKKNIRIILKEKIRSIIKKDRRTKILEFNNERIKWSNCIVSKNFTSRQLTRIYDAVVIGSDQIWNPYFPFASDSDYLPGINVKKIAYAASFGVDLIKEPELREHIAEMINGIDYISMREEVGAKMVKELTGRDAAVVLDPTLLLDAADWRKLERKPQMNIPSRYVLEYMLGESNANIEKIAGDIDAPILDISSKALPVGPREFLYLINHAQIICTDSFHASVFSMLFEKAFIIFDRVSDDADMSSRIDSFCEMFGMWNNRYSDEFDLQIIVGSDYQEAKKILAEEKHKSISFIKRYLK